MIYVRNERAIAHNSQDELIQQQLLYYNFFEHTSQTYGSEWRGAPWRQSASEMSEVKDGADGLFLSLSLSLDYCWRFARINSDADHGERFVICKQQ